MCGCTSRDVVEQLARGSLLQSGQQRAGGRWAQSANKPSHPELMGFPELMSTVKFFAGTMFHLTKMVSA
eukprot:6896128-Lingulodinium_polyedra.AAC.1